MIRFPYRLPPPWDNRPEVKITPLSPFLAAPNICYTKYIIVKEGLDVNNATQLVSLGSVTLATCGIMKLLLGHYPCLSVPRSVLVIGETLIFLSAVFSQQVRWSGIPELLFDGFISAACSVEMLESTSRRKKVGSGQPPNHTPRGS